MRSYCQLLGIVNMFIFAGCIFWGIGDRSNSGAPIVAGALTLNMGMAWLFVSGVHVSEDGRRGWRARPAVEGLSAFVVLAAMAIYAAR